MMGSVFLRAFRAVKVCVTARRCICNDSVRRFILENTDIAGEESLTPEIRLRLFTPTSRFWNERPEFWPFSDPYWAIYWPGGQAIARYLIDNPEICRDKAVLDLGSGCGASAIVAKKCGAEHVTANDIDSVAGLVTIMNSELNKLEPPVCVTDNMINAAPQPFDLILLGDMFYEAALATTLHAWLNRCIKTHNTTVIIGDPGRAAFEEHDIHQHLDHLVQYELPQSVREENYGMRYASVWRYT